jgi:hypothetical protein
VSRPGSEPKRVKKQRESNNVRAGADLFVWDSDGDDANDGDRNGHGHSIGAAGVGAEAEADTEDYVDGRHG